MRIFLSYGHDEYAVLVERLKADLLARSHEVWFDQDRLRPGGDWEIYIEEGFEWVSEARDQARFLIVMTPHSVRRPDGYCLNEIARAHTRRLPIIPIMAATCEPPLSISRIQWLDMRDCLPLPYAEARYNLKFARLLEAIEDQRLDFEGNQARLLRYLRPLPFETDILEHVERFTGRQSVIEYISAWLEDPLAERVLWITGLPGVGKTALAAYLVAYRSEVAAFHMCRFGHTQKSDPRRVVLSIAYQLASHLHAYQQQLTPENIEEIVSEENAKTLFHNLIVEPLAKVSPQPDTNIVILIDALDEATAGNRNELADLIASDFLDTPTWLRLIVTSRPEAEVMYPMQRFSPYEISTAAPENRADLRDYLERELQVFEDREQILEEAIELILQQSEGLFLYVHWIVEELRQGRLSLDDLEAFPQGLGGVYAQFFRRQFPDLKDFHLRFRPVLEVIVAAIDHLSVDFVSSLFDWSVYDSREILSVFGSLFPVSNGFVTPFHKSVVDWLTDQNRAGPYFVSDWEGHRYLAEHGWDQFLRGVDRMTPYVLLHVPTHMARIPGMQAQLGKLLLDFEWMRAKLEATDVLTLIADYDSFTDQDAPHWVQAALQRSVHVLAADRSQLASQLMGRLLASDHPDIQTLVQQALHSSNRSRLYPLTSSLKPPVGINIEAFGGHQSQVCDLSVAKDRQLAVSGSKDGTVKAWDLQTGAMLHSFAERSGELSGLAVTPDGDQVVTASQSGLKVWDLYQGEFIRQIGDPDSYYRYPSGDLSPIHAVRITSDKRFVVSVSGPSLQVWDFESGALLHNLSGHTRDITSLTLTSDGRIAVSACKDLQSGAPTSGEPIGDLTTVNAVRVWDLRTGRLLHTLPGPTCGTNDLALSSDDRYVLSVPNSGLYMFSDTKIRLWELQSGHLIQEFGDPRYGQGHTFTITSVAISPDNSLVLSGGGNCFQRYNPDFTLKIWDLESAELKGTFEVHSGPVVDIQPIPGEPRVVSIGGRCPQSDGSQDHSIRVWDLEGLQLMATFQGEDSLTCLVVPNKDTIIAGSQNGAVHILRLQ